jgi:hypothetical protein
MNHPRYEIESSGAFKLHGYALIVTVTAQEVRDDFESAEEYAKWLEGHGWLPVEKVSFPSGSIATLSEGKVTGIQRDPEIVQGVGAVPEVQPLPYFTERKAFDPFGPEFVVVSSTQAQPAAPVHPLQRDGAGAVFGSAYLI